MKLWNDNGVVCAEFEVLAEVFAFGDVFVIYAVDFVFTAFVPQEDDFLFGGPFSKAAGKGKCLQHCEVFYQGVFTCAPHLSQDVEFLADRVIYVDRHHRMRDVCF